MEMRSRRRPGEVVGTRLRALMEARREVERQVQTTVEGWRAALRQNT